MNINNQSFFSLDNFKLEKNFEISPDGKSLSFIKDSDTLGLMRTSLLTQFNPSMRTVSANQLNYILKEIEEIEYNNSKSTIAGYKPFPYHAMMFNLAYINESQGSIIILIDLLWKEIKEEWANTKKDNWFNDNIFTTILEKQIEKSLRFETSVPSVNELENFIENAIKISEKTIYDNDKYIYLLILICVTHQNVTTLKQGS